LREDFRGRMSLPSESVRCLEVGPLQANCYLFFDRSSGEAAVIDPGGDGELIAAELEREGVRPGVVINTHAHVDHIGANGYLLSRYGIPLAIHRLDAPALLDPQRNLAFLGGGRDISPPADQELDDGDAILVGNRSLFVLHTPGHTPGGICLLHKNESGPSLIFTGDTLFAGSIGRTDFPGGSLSALLESVRRRLFSLAPDTVVFPGHGPATSIGREMVGNPFF